MQREEEPEDMSFPSAFGRGFIAILKVIPREDNILM